MCQGMRQISPSIIPRRAMTWARWSAALSLNPPVASPSELESNYKKQLNSGEYGVIALFYPTTFSPAGLQPADVLPRDTGTTYRDLLNLIDKNSGESGLGALTQALETDPQYRPAGHGTYNSAHDFGIFAIWQKVPA